MTTPRPDQRRLQGSSYVDDDGAADPALEAALTSYGEGRDPAPAVLAALARSRLLVPVVAILGEVETVPAAAGGAALARDKNSDMATVLLTGADGRRALLAFTSTQTLAAWNPDARPVPVAAALAAATAVQEGADAMVVDVAGPVPFEVAGGNLHRIAGGWRPVRLADGGWAWLGSED